jgi:NAD(P)-dependent dehydrogenase (short-subunit alcohol dehydrogenase family)
MQRNTLSGASVVVTGASSGIGRATALEFARHGANVAVAARRAEPLREVAGECRRLGVRAIDAVAHDPVLHACAVRPAPIDTLAIQHIPVPTWAGPPPA